MLYYLTITLTLFYTVPTEDPKVFEVRSRKISDTRLFLNKEEAYTNYYRETALRPYRAEVCSIVLDSASICPLPPKK